MTVCANCGIKIEKRGAAYVSDGKDYCCRGCSEGGPCCCEYSPPEETIESVKTDSGGFRRIPA